MRRKITDGIEIDEEGLPELTPQRRDFTFLMLQGKSASDAYRAAFNCTNSTDRTIWAEASRLKNNPEIAAWLSAARKAGLGSAKVTLEGHVSELERLREIAIDSGNVGAAVQAEQLRGKASGHYTENLNISHTDPTSVLDEIRKLSPELADKLQEQHVPEWQGETLQ